MYRKIRGFELIQWICGAVLIALLYHAESSAQNIPAPIISGENSGKSPTVTTAPNHHAASQPISATQPLEPAKSTKQQSDPKAAANQTSDAYIPYNPNQKEISPYWDRPYLLAAYAAVWLVLLAYLLWLSRRLSRTDQEIQILKQRLQKIEW
jgi:CcmD family protein